MATGTLTQALASGSLFAGELGTMARNLYGPRVRMGNWNEDVYLEEMQLSVSEDGYVHYGDKVMLVNPDHPEIEAHLFLGGDLSLCMTPDEMQVHLSDDLEVPCGLSASQTKIPLYLSSDHRTLMRSSKRSWLQEVYLTDEDSYLNCWQAAFPDPQLRLEYEGFPIPVRKSARSGQGQLSPTSDDNDC
ncbi:Cilia- and flagella-associated protein 161 [Camelus dromedarius]|uniref:Cilia-and flagella-associated protein 161 n=1 Tax=Camelus dromedarius TaxID=9838 RepID=A0A5N4CFK9_CAMDR|nr:Cilia- and flagella-associated protein 161 [Camelus dromedarius]